jgi:ABC-type branched-subunit amino acid transport system substrate-binding protein
MRFAVPFLIFLLIFSTWFLVPAGAGTAEIQSDTGISGTGIVPGDPDPVPVGILVMKSGFIADIGQEYTRAFDMVREENPDTLVYPVIMDGGSERAVAVENWGKMKNETAYLPVVISVASWTSNVVYPDAADSGIIQIALGSAAINRSRSSDHLIWFTPGVRQESPILAGYMDQFNTIGIIGGDNDYSREYFSALDALLPGKIVLNSRYDQNNVQESLNITDIFRVNPDVLVLLSVSEGATVTELLRSGGITCPLIATRVIERNSLTTTGAAEGLIFTTPALNRSHPFFTRYFEKYGENATFYGAEGYDALTTLYAAVQECGNSRDCISSWYQNRSYNGALGSVRFDDRGVAVYPISFRIVSGGRFEEYPV